LGLQYAQNAGIEKEKSLFFSAANSPFAVIEKYEKFVNNLHFICCSEWAACENRKMLHEMTMS